MREINVIIIFGMHANNIYINQLAHMSTLLNREYYLSKDVGSIASRNYITLNEDNTVSDGVKLMRDSDISSIIITNKSTQQPTGIVTERDILYRVIGEDKNPSETLLKSIMSHPLVFINDKASIKEAICKMRNRHVRRLLVKKAAGGISGITTLRSAIGNIPSHGIDLAEVELPGETPSENIGKLAVIICPYHQSMFEDKEKIDKHMDTVHLLNC
jgi:predicted transcriptional regulator